MARKINFDNATKDVITRVSIVTPEHNPRKSGHCNFQLYVNERIIRCKHCGEFIDPFDALMEYANNERRFIWKVSKAKAAIEEFKKIQSEWSLTIREKRRIDNAQRFAKMIEIEDEQD